MIKKALTYLKIYYVLSVYLICKLIASATTEKGI